MRAARAAYTLRYCLSSVDKQVRFRDLDLVFKELQFFLDRKVFAGKGFMDRTL